MKRVLLTGATGFVGSHVSRILREAGHEVYALVRTSSQDNYLRYLGIKLLYGALEDNLLPKLSQQLPDVDAVIHIAGILKARKNSDFHKINALGTANLFSLIKKKQIPKFVLVSSISARGPNLPTSNLGGPVSYYGKSKLEAEQMILAEKKGPQVVVIRPPVVYGPGDRETLALFRFFERGYFPIIGHGAKRVSFVYVEDLAKILIQSAFSSSSNAGPYYPEDGSGGYSWFQIHQIAERTWGRKIKKIIIPLSLAKAGMAITDSFSKIKKKPTIYSLDKYSELKQDDWTCSVNSCLKDLTYTNSLVSLQNGLQRTRSWYSEKGWL